MEMTEEANSLDDTDDACLGDGSVPYALLKMMTNGEIETVGDEDVCLRSRFHSRLSIHIIIILSPNLHPPPPCGRARVRVYVWGGGVGTSETGRIITICVSVGRSVDDASW